MKSLIIMRKKLCLLLPLILFFSNSQADELSPAQYCTSKHGKVEIMNTQFDTHNGLVYGLAKKFCTFEKQGGFIVIGLDAFASKRPNLAATFIKKIGKISTGSLLWKGNYTNPSENVCKNMGGANINFNVIDGGFTDDLGKSDICVFGDGSKVSAWSLIYMANGRAGYATVKNDVRSQPMNINLP